jgi:hypothetical protein
MSLIWWLDLTTTISFSSRHREERDVLIRDKIFSSDCNSEETRWSYIFEKRSEHLVCVRRESNTRLQWLRAALVYNVKCRMNDRIHATSIHYSVESSLFATMKFERFLHVLRQFFFYFIAHVRHDTCSISDLLMLFHIHLSSLIELRSQISEKLTLFAESSFAACSIR